MNSEKFIELLELRAKFKQALDVHLPIAGKDCFVKMSREYFIDQAMNNLLTMGQDYPKPNGEEDGRPN